MIIINNVNDLNNINDLNNLNDFMIATVATIRIGQHGPELR